MERLTDQQSLELTADELRRVRDTLLQRFGGRGERNILGLSFGVKRAGGEFVAGERVCACFLVRRKRTPRSRVLRIEPREVVRLKRGGRFVEVLLDTDVEEAAAAEPTGVAVDLPDGARRDGNLSAGLLLRQPGGGRRATR